MAVHNCHPTSSLAASCVSAIGGLAALIIVTQPGYLEGCTNKSILMCWSAGRFSKDCYHISACASQAPLYAGQAPMDSKRDCAETKRSRHTCPHLSLSCLAKCQVPLSPRSQTNQMFCSMLHATALLVCANLCCTPQLLDDHELQVKVGPYCCHELNGIVAAHRETFLLTIEPHALQKWRDRCQST